MDCSEKALSQSPMKQSAGYASQQVSLRRNTVTGGCNLVGLLETPEKKFLKISKFFFFF